MLAGALVAHLVLPLAGSAQSVRGVVIDVDSGEPIAIATVTLVSASGERVASALTTEDGFFTLEADDGGLYLVRAVALGYAPNREGPVQLESGGVLVLEMRLTPAPVGIEGVVVEGAREGRVGNYLTRRGFWDRYEEGRGQFLTPGEVLASDAMFTPQLLRELDHVIPQYGAAPWSVWPTLRSAAGAGPCEPRVYVDDVWMNREGFGIRESGLGLDDIVPIDRVQAVEVYYGAFQAPIRYQGTTRDNSCGVILIWTRG